MVNRIVYWISKKQHFQNKVSSLGLKYEARNDDHLYAHLAKEHCSLGQYADEKNLPIFRSPMLASMC